MENCYNELTFGVAGGGSSPEESLSSEGSKSASSVDFTDNSDGLDGSSTTDYVSPEGWIEKAEDLQEKKETQVKNDIKSGVGGILSNEESMQDQLGIKKNVSEEKLSSDNTSEFSKSITRGIVDILPDGVSIEDVEKEPTQEKDTNWGDIIEHDPTKILEAEEQRVYGGDLSYEQYKSMDHVPERVDGDLLFSDCISVQRMELPRKVDKSIYAEGLESIEEVNILLSQIKEIGGYVYINKDLIKNNADLMKTSRPDKVYPH